jgi:Trypsin
VSGAITSRMTLVGVVSFGDGCARALKYGVYTRLANYTTWVQRTMRQPREEDSTERVSAGPSETSVGATSQAPQRTGPMSVPPSETPVATNELEVNESDWSQLSQNEKDRIEVILRGSRLIEQDVAIVPRSETPRMGDPRLFGGLSVWVCKRACETAGVAAGTACATLTSGVGAPVCGGLAASGVELCKKACK